MKYIKILNNKIIQYDENAKDLDKPAILFYKDDIKEADAIEELCDWFAFEDAFDAKMFGPSLFSSKSLARLYAEKKIRKVVGYIVIEKKGVKTLEPVMKTNEKGEFELL